MRHILTRLRDADVTDWLFGLLFAVVAAAVALGIYIWLDDEPEPFNAIGYAAPAQVIDIESMVPQVEGTNLPTPSITVGEQVPVRLTRTMTCDTSDCPPGGIPLEITVKWQELILDTTDDDDNTTQSMSVTILEDFETQIQEGTDYEVGVFSIDTTQLTPFDFPDEVRSYILENDLDVSVWRIEGVTLPLIGGADPVGWSTEPIHIQNIQPEGE